MEDDVRPLLVFDTNILVQMALARSGLWGKVKSAWRRGDFELAISLAMLDELHRVLHYPKIQQTFRLSEQDITRFCLELERHALLTADLYQIFAVKQNATDNPILACALESDADYLVSEDNHLRELKYYHGIQIIGLSQLAELLELNLLT